MTSRGNIQQKYKFFFPGSWGYSEFYGSDEKEAREAARSWLGVNRLPRGTFVELYDHKAAEAIRKNNERMVKGTSLMATDLY